MDRFKLMESFVTVVQAGSFVAASKKLGTSRSLLSKHIGQLEKALGMRILSRDTHSLGLTEAGTEYYQFCTHVLEEIKNTEATIVANHQHASGQLRILVPQSFGTRFMSQAISDFSDRCPEIGIHLSMWGQAASSHAPDFHAFDVIIRATNPPDSSFIVRKVAPIRHVFCATPSYLAIHGEPQSIDELSGHACLCHELNSDVSWRYRRKKGATSLRGPRSSVPQTNSYEILRQWTLAGRGIGHLIEFVAYTDLQAGRLQQILGDYQTEEHGLYVLYPNTRYLPLKTRLFIDFFAAHFSEPPWIRARR